MEKIINVPVDEAMKAELKRRAEENGRAVNREAAAILKRELGTDKARGRDNG